MRFPSRVSFPGLARGLVVMATMFLGSLAFAQTTQAPWLTHAWYVTPRFTTTSYRGTVRRHEVGASEREGSFTVDDWTCSWQMHHTSLAPCGQLADRFSDPSSIIRLECLTSRGDGFAYEHHCHDGSRGVRGATAGTCEPVEQPSVAFTLHDQVSRRRRATGNVRNARVSVGCETRRAR